MVRWIKEISKTRGKHPGEVIFVGEQKAERVIIERMEFDDASLSVASCKDISECLTPLPASGLTWINIDGLHDVTAIRRVCDSFGIPALIQEDIANTGQRPKLEEGQNFIFLAVKMVYPIEADGDLISEQVSVVFGPNFVISFQEEPGDVFDPIRERIRRTTPREKLSSSDYLAYALIDAVVDNYFVVLERAAEEIEQLENRLLDNPSPEVLEEIHELRRMLLYLRKVVWPLREVIGNLERSTSPFIHSYTRPYLRDLYEHTIQVIDTVEIFREMVSGLLDIYLSSVSNRLNQVMKVLTIIATIFIPLSFLAAVYGMNFDTNAGPLNMPELGFKYGYPLFWLVAMIIAISLLFFFKRKKWL